MAKNKKSAIKEIENKLKKMGFKKVEEKSEIPEVFKKVKYPQLNPDVLAVREKIKYNKREKSKK